MRPGVPANTQLHLTGWLGWVATNASKIIYSRGCNDTSWQDTANFSASAMTVSSADAGILVIGLSQSRNPNFGTGRPCDYQVTRRTSSMKLSEPLWVSQLCLWSYAADWWTFHLQRTIVAFKHFVGGISGWSWWQSMAKVIFGDHNPDSA